jgi:hypothetical protein
MLKEFIRVQLIISISYVLLKFTRDFKDTFLQHNFYIFKYEVFDRFIISTFFILLMYNILLINCAIEKLIEYIFNYHNRGDKFNFKNYFIRVHYNDELNNCPICLDEFIVEENNNICKLIQCSHYYHHKCIEKWYNSQYDNLKQLSCPICRANKTD